MPVFSYEAIRRGGARSQGEIEARSRAEACDQLERQAMQPLWVKVRSGSEGREGAPVAPPQPAADTALPEGGFSLSARQTMQFTEELSDLLDAGLQLEQALRIMENRGEVSNLKRVCVCLRSAVRDGVSFSAALRRTSPSFGDLFCNLVAAGEQSGSLGSILKRSLAYQKLVAELKSKVAGALIYPAFIALAGLILITLFVSYLVPQLGVLLGTTGNKMPLPTMLLISGSHFLADWWWAILLALAGLGALARWAVSTTAGRRWWHRNQLRIPLVGTILRAKFLAQLAQTLATLVTNGIALHSALRLTQAATPNVFLQATLASITDAVGEGIPLSRAVARTGAFPPVFIDMIVVGEQSGNLALSLEKTGERYDKELNVAIGTLTSMIQPAVIVVMAGIVGLVAYSMMGGIFQAVSGLRG
jgi:type II secretory pathway component PulF